MWIFQMSQRAEHRADCRDIFVLFANRHLTNRYMIILRSSLSKNSDLVPDRVTSGTSLTSTFDGVLWVSWYVFDGLIWDINRMTGCFPVDHRFNFLFCFQNWFRENWSKNWQLKFSNLKCQSTVSSSLKEFKLNGFRSDTTHLSWLLTKPNQTNNWTMPKHYLFGKHYQKIQFLNLEKLFKINKQKWVTT